MRYLRLGISGLHGLIGPALTVNGALRYASALGTWVGTPSPRIGIAMDSRISSPMLKSACLSGLLSTGAQICDCGVCPAPLLNYCVTRRGLDGALMIGAGHHPAGWNAIAPVSSGGAPFTPSQSQELLDIYHSGVYTLAPWNALGKVETLNLDSLIPGYMDMLASFIDAEAVARAHFRVICDFCNGAGSIAAEAFARRFGIEMIPLNGVPSGVLPHDPEPRPRSSMQLASLMPHLKAHAGFVFNSDATRVAVVTDTAETLSEEYTFPLVARHLLTRSPKGSAVVTNCCSTRTLDDVVAEAGGQLFKSKVGQAYTIDKMFETSAVLSGDGSGSVAFAHGVPAFDSFAVMGMILEAMAVEQTTLSHLAQSLPRYHIIKTSMSCPSAHAYKLLRSLRARNSDAVLSGEDGLRFDWPDGWVHLRFSMTEPVIRLIAEWKDRELAEQKVMQFRSQIERIISAS